MPNTPKSLQLRQNTVIQIERQYQENRPWQASIQ